MINKSLYNMKFWNYTFTNYKKIDVFNENKENLSSAVEIAEIPNFIY